MGIPLSALLQHYKRPEIQNALVAGADNKEVAVKFGDKGFGKRPDTLTYPNDVLNFAKKGATSFHASEEHWTNPLQLQPGVPKKELDNLRSGWDLILDIDCTILDYSKIAADLLIQALQHYDIDTFGIKFSGNHGFHIGVPRTSFPTRVHGMDTKNLFPDGPRRIAAFLGAKIKLFLAEKILEYEPIHTIAKRLNKPVAEIVQNNQLNPYAILAIDTVLISSRHLYRMAYSFNEKSGLVSTPIKPKDVLNFDKKTAQWDRIGEVRPFLTSSKSQEAVKLITESFDYTADTNLIMEEEKKHADIEDITTSIPVEHFPPCIKLLLQGMQDGKKRSLFVLTNFLSSVGWNKEQITALVQEWNKKNPEQLREVLIQGHLRYHDPHQKKMPPNCANPAYYPSLNICKPDNLCKKIKNPVNYAIVKFKQKNFANSDAARPHSAKFKRKNDDDNYNDDYA
ncbi:hypothetical protein HY490_02770 [Candidatus Woesearchaeota archaeon]|nr:hypothetical protein [Candidatus Woesearchaeota archaeon]